MKLETFVKLVAGDRSSSEREARKWIDAIFAQITVITVSEGDEILIPKFGRFVMRHDKARITRGIPTPPTKRLAFRGSSYVRAIRDEAAPLSSTGT